MNPKSHLCKPVTFNPLFFKVPNKHFHILLHLLQINEKQKLQFIKMDVEKAALAIITNINNNNITKMNFKMSSFQTKVGTMTTLKKVLQKEPNIVFKI